MRILLVDDDFLITTALKTILEADEEIEVCGSGKSGKEAEIFPHPGPPDSSRREASETVHCGSQNSRFPL